MDDITAKLTELLNDPGQMEKVKMMAQSFMGGSQSEPENKNDSSGGLFDSISPNQMMEIANVFSSLSNYNDKRTGLLLALKPYLSPERGERIDRSIKLLKLVGIMPSISKMGLFDL